jgi:Protein of unknown function (DUF2958)
LWLALEKFTIDFFPLFWYGASVRDAETPSPRGHELLPKDIRERLPPLYANEKLGLEALALVKFFTPDSNWTWYASEFDGEDIFFGLVSGFEIELGYFSLSELESIKGPLGLLIKRDLHFEPKTLKELMEFHENERSRPSPLERDQPLMSLEELIPLAAEMLLRRGEVIPTVIIETHGNLAVGQIPDMPETHQERVELMRFLGEETAKSGRVEQLEQVFMVTEGWMSEGSEEMTKHRRPSNDPNRKEVLIVSAIQVKEQKKLLKILEIVRDSDEEVVLKEVSPSEGKEGSVELPLLEAFVEGFQTAFKTKFN